MIKVYRGHKITVKREICADGYDLLYYDIRDIAGNFMCDEGFSEDAGTVFEFIQSLKSRVDSELKLNDPWGYASLLADCREGL
jgi:hypothetical protein